LFREYIRQSSLKQVLRNTESAIRQYDLRGKAISLGWDASQITVIDIDQGQSGASAADREGFHHLVAEVSLGRAGIVLGLECSRLARNSADWHQLLGAVRPDRHPDLRRRRPLRPAEL
jgi:DNA invertase Pin-like site-specific DNA recombinase